jgi:hypothetical protein
MVGVLYLEHDSFKLYYDEISGYVNTVYPDGTNSGCYPNEDDAYHGRLLGISAGQHRLLHELAHHVIGLVYSHKTCPIVWADAHGLEMPENAQELEWIITAISYFCLEKTFRHAHEWGALRKLADTKDPWCVGDDLAELFKPAVA